MAKVETVRFACPECDKTWPRYQWSTTVLRGIVAAHLWTEHGIRRADSEDLLPMTNEQVEWVRAQRAEG